MIFRTFIIFIFFLTIFTNSFAITKAEYLEKLHLVLSDLASSKASNKLDTAKKGINELLSTDYSEDNQLKNATLQLYSQLHTNVWIDLFVSLESPKYLFGHMAYLLYYRGDLQGARYFTQFLKEKDLSLFQEPHRSSLKYVFDKKINNTPSNLDNVLSVKKGENYEVFGRFNNLEKIDQISISRFTQDNILYSTIQIGQKRYVSSDQNIRFVAVCNDIIDSLVFLTNIADTDRYIKYSFNEGKLVESDFKNKHFIDDSACLADGKSLFFIPPCSCNLKPN